MKRLGIMLALGVVSLTASCKDFLDVNTNPNAPQSVSANLYLSPMEHWMVTAPQYDGRFVGRYTQEWALTNGSTSVSTWDRMGYDASSDNGAEQWRDVYWSLGQNLADMITKAEAEQRWDIAGAGYFMKAWGWLVLTDLHGEIIVKEALDPTRSTFDYDTQDTVYATVARLIDQSITDLKRTDGAVDPVYFGKTDHLYNGSRTKWLKMAYGLKAIMLNHYSNKSTYNPAAVIANVDSSFQSNADDALYPYPCQDPAFADCNFWGTHRQNIQNYRQTQFVVHLMDGTDFNGVVDPRMTRMLAPDSLTPTQYVGVDPNLVAYGAIPSQQRPFNFWGYPGSTGVGSSSRYIFDDRTKFPFMTYAQLQFVKAEAAYRKGDLSTALNAYQTAISSHIDFVNARNSEIASQSATPITGAEKQAFLSSAVGNPGTITLRLIMSQKYIAQWAWGHNELWMDMRRYHYTDPDPATGAQVYPGFTPPTSLFPDNSGKVVQRIRPRYNSEYVWNVAGLTPVGGLALDYHTKPLWITQP